MCGTISGRDGVFDEFPNPYHHRKKPRHKEILPQFCRYEMKPDLTGQRVKLLFSDLVQSPLCDASDVDKIYITENKLVHGPFCRLPSERPRPRQRRDTEITSSFEKPKKCGKCGSDFDCGDRLIFKKNILQKF